jgi:exopolysaccharide biosynthesis polyprenyl glycosylphosphotransferase
MLLARRTLLGLIVAAFDAVALVASFGLAYIVVEVLFDRWFVSFLSYAQLLAVIVPAWLCCLYAFGAYSVEAYKDRRSLMQRLVLAESLAALLLFSTMYLTHAEAVSRLLLQAFVVVSSIFLAARMFAIEAYLDSVPRHVSAQRRKVLLVSIPAAAECYIPTIRAHFSMLVDVVGILTPTECTVSTPHVAPVLGTAADLPLVLRSRVVDEVFIALPLDHGLLKRLGSCCSLRGITLRILIDAPHWVSGTWSAEYFREQGSFVLSLTTIPQDPLSLLVKRLIDLLGAVIGLLVCGIAYVRFATLVRRETGDSVVFRQKRVGQNGRRFILYKFRTMYAGAEQKKAGLTGQNAMSGPIFKVEDDPRVTPTGHKLRRRHLDELPQFWNVLKGEMSLVGTRPPTEDETAAYLEHHCRRLSMKPGLTGLWQLNGNGSVKDFEDIVKLDCEYIDNWSLWLDCKIVVQTVGKVVRGDAW